MAAKGQIVRRVVGTCLLIFTIGFTGCQSLIHSFVGVFAEATPPSEIRNA